MACIMKVINKHHKLETNLSLNQIHNYYKGDKLVTVPPTLSLVCKHEAARTEISHKNNYNHLLKR